MRTYQGEHNVEGGSSGGVGRLVAQFESREFNPPLPPRPSQQQAPSPAVNSPQASSSYGMFHPSSMGSMSSMSQQTSSPHPQSPPINTHFGSFNSLGPNQMQSPVNSPVDNSYGSFGGQSRVASPPMASPSSSMSFAGFHDSRVSTPTAPPAANQFGNLDNFMTTTGPSQHAMVSNHQTVSESNSSATTTSSIAPGTPGFAIWRPPPSGPSNPAPEPINSNPPPSSQGNNSFRPPVPPKPIINTSNQFILELNPSVKSKAKAPAKPPRPRAPSMASVNAFSPEVKQEAFSTPVPETPSSSASGTIVSCF